MAISFTLSKNSQKKNGKCLIKNICSKSHAFPKHFGSKLGCFKLVRSAHQPSLNSAMRRGVRVDGGGRLEDGEGAGLMDRNWLKSRFISYYIFLIIIDDILKYVLQNCIRIKVHIDQFNSWILDATCAVGIPNPYESSRCAAPTRRLKKPFWPNGSYETYKDLICIASTTL